VNSGVGISKMEGRISCHEKIDIGARERLMLKYCYSLREFIFLI
jgi:hypothetical protein